ncbi:uncharacterized protein B0T15DRAFT_506695 [Chaetomium strumarium]|uniref:PD-(D/E)XK nuclease-like domain-containing protein n=1 Tax=Chaetomium strumarium TaxID=1170767 RepID=A0AAJ0H1T9_9PEZI|nr:hypothetical protein B0T15DRAFT_506695 [Chaetomium strumarium]
MQHDPSQAGRRLFVNQWLDSIIISEADTPLASSLSLPCSVKKRKRKFAPRSDIVNDNDDLAAHQPIMSTPPRLLRSGRARPWATRGCICPIIGHVGQLGKHHKHIGKARASARSNSPTKKPQELRALQKPILFVNMGDGAQALLHEDVTELYKSLSNITYRMNIFPGEAEAEINKAAETEFPPFCFRAAAAGVRGAQQEQQGDGNGRTGMRREEQEDKGRALAELRLLRKLLRAAVQCQHMGSSDAERNVLVHGPILQHALEMHAPHVNTAVVTTAAIAKPFIPRMGEHAATEFVEKKMVDFALVLDLAAAAGEGNGRQDWYSDLNGTINRVVESQPVGEATVNQSLYGPMCYRPVAVSIETRTGGGGSSAVEGRTQLAAWTAAWHERVKRFQREGGERVVTLPLILVNEHAWQLSFACDRGDRLEIVGHMTLGETNSLSGMYQLVAAVGELGRWIEGPFARWIARILGGPSVILPMAPSKEGCNNSETCQKSETVTVGCVRHGLRTAPVI